MNAGLILTDKVEKESVIAFLGEETVCEKANTNNEIIELIEEEQPEIIAVNVGSETVMDEFTESEEELKEEGFSFVPNSHSPKLVKRLDALTAQLFQEMGAKQPEVIRFEPQVTADELALHGDEGLESLGVDTSGIESAEEFDAVLGAVTARFYQQNQYRDLGVIVPESLESDEEENT